MASLLNNYQQDVLDRRAYFDALGVYSRSHQLKLPDGKIVPWIDEDQNPFTGDWIVRRKPCYSASQSVLGGRLKQPIKDIASQIEVITPEFISDFAITSVADAFRYSLNVENGEEFLTPSDGGEREAWSGKTHGRIRGIFPSKFSTSRNLFSSITKNDTYNTGRISIASGAQSMLFSLGEPAGIADVHLNDAEMRNFGKVKATLNSEQGYRYELDVNRELLKKRLALRLDYLIEDQPSFIKPSYNKNQRYYRMQFNVRNLLTDENSYRSMRTDAFGISRFTMIETPRSYSASLELSF